jgi:hypothetical protein
LEAIAKTHEAVLVQLHEKLLPEFLKLRPKSKKATEYLKVDCGQQERILEQLRPAIENWAQSFHLWSREESVPLGEGGSLLSWMKTIILATLMDWAERKSSERNKWCIPFEFSAVAHVEDPAPFRFESEGWALSRQTEAKFRNTISGEFHAALDAYVEKHSRSAEQLGWVRLPENVLPEHFEWLVRYQICRQSQREIIAETGTKRKHSAVAAGIRNAARLVAGEHYRYWLRPPLPPGPRKRSSS